ncbi:GNAT family N-acetyltransferase [Kineococcus sp. SYSU DK006]|uniref:GNAT family N-acetyltransferase n=1 Tax=Kineococcus sp. SYSU DK006 TaxID=3383127 RepID=UPI003D7EE530
MLTLHRQLPPDALRAVADLERRAVAVDGGRLKIAWSDLRARRHDGVNDLLWTEAGRVVGYASLDVHGGPGVEVAGVVDPAARRRGIGSALLGAAVDVCRQRGAGQVLLIVPRGSSAGRHLAERRGARLHHSEHAMLLDGPPVSAEDPRTNVRPAAAADVALVERLLREAFGVEPVALADSVAEGGTRVVEHDGQPVGTLRVDVDGGVGGVWGFAVTPASRGRGIGRDVLGRVCRELLAGGSRGVRLEVEVDNDHALGLYTSLGFRQVLTEDYYDVPLEPLR